MSKEIPIKSSPIHDVVISHVSQQYGLKLKSYLEGLGCRVTPRQGERGKHHIQFPTGTTENTYTGQFTQRMHRTMLILPGGARIIKFILLPLKPGYPVYCTLSLPNEVKRGPEPQQTPSIRPG